ncbi:MAG: hypothetical protein HYV04_06910 [Deltaproteobacteria bacterium]|nr:hypothetical protein [Deltaproteobacteria bacterium]
MATFMLISENFRNRLCRVLRKYEEDEYGKGGTCPLSAVIEKAPTINLPELHTFQESDGSLFQICGFSREDAESRANNEPWRKKPFTWQGSAVPWPGMYSVNLAPWAGEEDPQA